MGRSRGSSHPRKTVQRRILLIGATGQIGHELLRALRPIGDVLAPGRASGGGLPALDLSRPDGIRSAVRELRPHLIVNAGGYTAVDRAEEETQQAMAVNGVAPGILAEEAKRVGAGLIHYSTDYVFDGGGTRAWREGDAPRPLNAYGRSKLAGELAIQAVGVPCLIMRTSWVHGTQGRNFVKTMLRLAAAQTSLRIVNDQIGGPTSAQAIADVTARILHQAPSHFPRFFRDQGGILHLACSGETSRHEFALEIFRQAKASRRGLAIQEVVPVASDDYPTKAKRPKNSRLDCTRLAQEFGIALPSWETGLQQTLHGILEARPPDDQRSWHEPEERHSRRNNESTCLETACDR